MILSSPFRRRGRSAHFSIIAVCTLMLALLAVPMSARAADQPAAELSPDTPKAMRELFDLAKVRLTEAEATLTKPDLSDAQLNDLRDQVTPIADRLQTLIGSLTPRVAAAKQRLDQLSAKSDVKEAEKTAQEKSVEKPAEKPAEKEAEAGDGDKADQKPQDKTPAQPKTQAQSKASGDGAEKAPAAADQTEETEEAPAEKPPEKPAADASDIDATRKERLREYTELNDANQLASTLLVQANQIRAHITDRRRALFSKKLFEQSSSVFSPSLWLNVAGSAPSDLKAVTTISGDWFSSIRMRTQDGRAYPLLLALLLAGACYLIPKWLAPRVAARNERITEPTPLRRSLAAAWRTLFATLPAALAALLVYGGLSVTYLLPQRIEPIIVAILASFVLVVFSRALAEAILAPSAPAWRVVGVTDAAAEPLYRLVFVGSLLLAVGRVSEVMLQTVGASVASSVALRAVVTALVALLIANTMRQVSVNKDCDEDSLGPYVAPQGALSGSLRILAWVVVLVALGGVAFGFVAFASFIIDQCVWLAMLAAITRLLFLIVDETIGKTLTGDGRVSVALQTSVGLRRRSLDQFAVVMSGLLKVAITILALLLALAPWGIESNDYVSSLRAAFFGVQLGGIKLSLSVILEAVGLFAGVILVTRTLQRWLENKYLPVAGVDSGLRNSITTAVGYLGTFVAAAVALGQMGLSLDKIAIVAGALSVGIGFGLQSIVNNFVSGLILLWERSISVGDWIVVGGEQGYVKRINVRATEIQTFERAAVIVPNSSLVSGVVKNWLHNNRTGRIAIVVTVPFQQDPSRVAALLTGCATAHPDVLTEPKPSALFNKFTDTTQEFELRCFADVESTLRIKSELNYQLFQKLTEAGIYEAPGVPASEVTLKLPQDIEQLLADVARGRSSPSSPAPAAARSRTRSSGGDGGADGADASEAVPEVPPAAMGRGGDD